MSRFVPNPVGIAQVAALPGLVAFFGTEAAKIADAAKANAPVESGEFIGSISSTCGIDGDHAFGRAFSVDDKAVYLEFGTGHPGPTPAFQPFRKAIESYRV